MSARMRVNRWDSKRVEKERMREIGWESVRMAEKWRGRRKKWEIGESKDLNER